MARLAERVLVVGMDGATLDLIEPWVAQGLLPAFSALLAEGARGRMRSVIHPYTAQAWTTMVTGVNAGRHRIFDFLERDFSSYGFRLVDASMRAWPAFWELLSGRDQEVIVVNVPLTYPPDRVRGLMISGREAPGLGSQFTYPPQLKEELGDVAGGEYIIAPDDWRWMQRGRPDRAREELLREVEVRFRVLRHFLSRHDWRVAMFVVAATDGVAHLFWHFCDPTHPLHDPSYSREFGNTIFEVYQRADRELGTLLEMMPSRTGVLVVSDHGSGGIINRALHLNLWLAKHGLLSFRHGVSTTLQRRLGQTLDGLKGALYRNLSWQTIHRLRRAWPNRVRRHTLGLAMRSEIDFARSSAFSEEWRGNIWLNVQGRDPLGIIPPGDDRATLQNATAGLIQETLEAEGDTPLVRRAWRREELFSGPYVRLFPDLLLETETPELFRRAPQGCRKPLRVVGRSEMGTFRVSGDHRYEGVLVASGPGVVPGRVVESPTLLDVVPTLLYWLGEPVPRDLDGRVLKELFRPDVLTEYPVRVGDPVAESRAGEEHRYSPTDEVLVAERLKGLGYLD